MSSIELLSILQTLRPLPRGVSHPTELHVATRNSRVAVIQITIKRPMLSRPTPLPDLVRITIDPILPIILPSPRPRFPSCSLQCVATRDKENNCVPQPLEWENRSGSDVVLERRLTLKPAVDTVKTARNPSYQDAQREEETRAKIRALDRIVDHELRNGLLDGAFGATDRRGQIMASNAALVQGWCRRGHAGVVRTCTRGIRGWRRVLFKGDMADIRAVRALECAWSS